MRAHLARICAGLVAVVLSTTSHAAPPMVLTHSASDQTVADNGTLTGMPHAGKRAFYVELVRALLAQLNLPDRIQEVPLARGLLMVQQQDDVVFFNLDRTAEREALMQWVGPISVDADALFERTSAPTGIASLDDARERSVCVLRGNVHDRMLAARHFTRLVQANSYPQCFQLLAAGRVQLVASAVDTVPEKLAAARIEPSEVRQTPVQLMTTEGYIVMSRNISANDVARWRQALDQLKATGRFRDLRERYMPSR